MAITNTQKDALNNMCISAKTYKLGDIIEALENKIHGTAIVGADEQTAGSIDIDTGLDVIEGFIVQIYRANILLGSYDVQVTGGVLTIATNGTDYVVTENDVINYSVY